MNEQPIGLVLGGSNVYVAIQKYTDLDTQDSVLLKYSDAGILQSATTSGIGQKNWPLAIAANPNLNYFIFSMLNGGEYIRIFDKATGSMTGAITYESPAAQADKIDSMYIDNSGNIYVGGVYDRSGDGTDDSIVTFALDSDGSLLWRTTQESGTYAGSYGVVKDSSGNVYVCGNYGDSILTASMFVLKCDSNGDLKWFNTYSTSASRRDFGQGIAMDSSGNVWVAAAVNVDIMNAETDTSFRTELLKYNTSGSLLNVITYEASPAIAADTGLVIDSSDNIYFSAYAISGSRIVPIIVKMDSAGNVLWQKAYESSDTYNYFPQGLALDGSGNIYTAGGRLTSLDPLSAKIDRVIVLKFIEN